jgi:hypothetical protein
MRVDEPAGDRDGPPPPPWQRAARRRDRVIVAVASAAAIALAVPVGVVAYELTVAAGDVDLSAGGDAQPPVGDGGGGGGSTAPPVEVPDLDVDGLSGVDAVYGQMLVDIDRAERAMIGAQEDIAAAFAGASPDETDPEALSAEVSEAAGGGQRELQQIRQGLAAPVEDATARQLRDAYLAHLDAWVRYLVAIEQEPGLVATEDGAEVLTLAIATTGDAFADIVREDLPSDLDDGVREVADAIIERGFPEGGPPGDGAV